MTDVVFLLGKGCLWLKRVVFAGWLGRFCQIKAFDWRGHLKKNAKSHYTHDAASNDFEGWPRSSIRFLIQSYASIFEKQHVFPKGKHAATRRFEL
jgi:hypothetical protein